MEDDKTALNDTELQLGHDIVQLHLEIARLHTLLHEMATFMRYDPPYGARRLRTWQAERDALVERALWAVQPGRKLSDVPLSDYLTSQKGNTMSTYDLRYNAFQNDDPLEDKAATTHDLDGLISLIEQHVIPCDYCWIHVQQDDVETGKGQYYRSELAGILLEAIEEHDAATGLETQVNERVAHRQEVQA